MKTKVFISWSGETSKRIAEVLKEWIPAVLQFVEPYFTPNDIEKGARWSKEIAEELQQSKVGIFCLTKENLTSKWMMFEAGAISKNLSASYVCPLLFDVDFSDLEGPLTQFQMSKFSKLDMLKLLRTINNACDDGKLSEKILENVFEKWWEDLNEKINPIIIAGKSKEGQIRSDRDLMEEVLSISRNLNKAMLGRPELVDLLAEYRAKMSGVLRPRTARILGLLNLFSIGDEKEDKQKIIEKLNEEVLKLDTNHQDLLRHLGNILGYRPGN